MQISKINQPKIQLLDGPTPLQELKQLTAYLGGPKIFLKRDDLGPSGGGNKIRKFERQFAKAKSEGADTLILAAHSQSNCARELVGAAAQNGFETVIAIKDLVARHDLAYQFNGNALLMNLMDTRFVAVSMERDFMNAMEEIADDVKSSGKTPYILPFGASDGLGVSGYVDSGREILEQCRLLDQVPSTIIVATGSCGTHAGLLIALEEYSVDTQVRGFSILHDENTARQEIQRLVTETIGDTDLKSKINVDCRALGTGYGEPTDSCIEAIKLVARLEGIFLDPVYTGKAMAGLIDWLPESGLGPDDTIVFVHTGGSFLLFAYQEIFQ